ncbi:MAG TPA: kelch repeat-containing protein, partial [Candidatus Limnocylindria bacterium]|nr:kelch repeat-containing protein [Candidatus Limnocylindria bacterium]
RYGSCGGIGPDGRLWISHGFTDDAGRFRDTRAYDFQSGSWADLAPAGGPVERCLHDCFWTGDGRLVLYAGQTTGLPALGDLWTYQPTTNAWTEAAPAPPPARQLYAVAVAGEHAYVFGGGDIDRGYLDDLWRLTLTDLSWTELAPAGEAPAARAGATLITDPARGRLLLFGGQNQSGELDDLWVLAAAGG